MLLLLLSLSLFALVSYYFIVIQLFGCSAISVQQNSVSVSDHFAGGIHSQSLDWYQQTKKYRKIYKQIQPQKQSMQNNAKRNYPGSVAYYDTSSVFHNDTPLIIKTDKTKLAYNLNKW